MNSTAMPGRQPADVRLGDAGVDLHLGQVLGDGEQRGRLQRGGHRLADVDVARDDDAVDRRDDGGVGEVGLRPARAAALACDSSARADGDPRRPRVAAPPARSSTSAWATSSCSASAAGALVLRLASAPAPPRRASPAPRAESGWRAPWPPSVSNSCGSMRAITWPFLTRRVEVDHELLDAARTPGCRPAR